MNGFDGGDEKGTVAAGHLAVGPLAEVVATPDVVCLLLEPALSKKST